MLDRVADERPAASPGPRGKEVVRTTTLTPAPRRRRPKTTGARDREHREREEVVEGHRQVEEVRGERPGERRGQPPRERAHARPPGRRAAASARPSCARRAGARKSQQTKSAKSAVPTIPVSTSRAT